MMQEGHPNYAIGELHGVPGDRKFESYGPDQILRRQSGTLWIHPWTPQEDPQMSIFDVKQSSHATIAFSTGPTTVDIGIRKEVGDEMRLNSHRSRAMSEPF